MKRAREKNYTCDICNEKFCTAKSLRQHRINFHDSRIRPDQWKQCPECDYVTAGRNRTTHMQIHILKMHPNVCPKCYEKFETKADFDNHLATSTCSPKTENELKVDSILALAEQIKRMMK